MPTNEAAKRAAAAVSEQRLWQRHMAMAEIGKIRGGGVDRPCLSPAGLRARALLLEWTEQKRYRAAVDDMANLFVRRPGRDRDAAPVLAGSHMDSRPGGGRFDGIFGVLAALEAMAALDAAGIQTRRPVDLVAWTNEEGGRFGPGAMGSAVFSGARRLDDCLDLTDARGIRLGTALAETLAATSALPRRPFGFEIAAYVEPHIEQGRQLEASGLPIGVVTSLQGARWYVVEVVGEAGHAGAARRGGRKDALRATAAMISALGESMDDATDQLRFTVGRLDVEPNAPNAVPARATFSIDIRHPDAAVLEDRAPRIEAICRRLAGACEVRVRPTFAHLPCAFPSSVVGAIERAVGRLQIPHMRLSSGTCHHANFLAEICPTGMILVPCANGISPGPAENARPEDLTAGARVLAATLVELAGSA